MNTYLANLWDSLRTSFWFVPAVLGIAAILASFILPEIDERTPAEWVQFIQTTTPAARSTLSAIAAAMMTVAGTVFSITVVTLSLTSQQFGPRLLRSFMLDFPTQLTIGTFLATGLYCLLVLRIVEEHEPKSVPHLSVALAVGMTVLSMGLLIFFVHHVAVLIQAPHIVSAVARDLDESISRLFPDRIGESGAKDGETLVVVAREQRNQLGDDFTEVSSTSEGYLQAIDDHGLLHFAKKRHLVIELLKRPGHYMCRGDDLGRIWGCEKDARDEATVRLNEFFIVGMRRTPRQDVECAIDELVEVAVRSLSPGINDPFTAINCIDHLRSTLGRLAERKIPDELRCDNEGQLRVIARSVTFPDVLAAAFNQIRQYGGHSPAVMIRLLEAFESILKHTSRPDDRKAVLGQADMVLRAAENKIDEPSDLGDIRKIHLRLTGWDGVAENTSR